MEHGLGLVWASGVASALLLALAVLLHQTTPRPPARRLLLVFLALESLTLAWLAVGNSRLAGHPYGGLLIPAGMAVWIAASLWYLRILRLLETPWVAGLRRKWVLPAIATALALQVGLMTVVIVPLALQGLGPADGAADPALGRKMALLFLPLVLAIAGISIYGLAASASAWRRAPRGTLARDRARAFALAFSARDLGVVLSAAPDTILQSAGLRVEGLAEFSLYAIPVGSLAFALLFTYGMLRTQILDLRARVRFAVSRSATAAVFLAVYVVASQAASDLVAPRWGLAAGLLAAGALVLALVPIQRLAERITTAAMPDETGSWIDRRLEIYLAALEDHEASGRDGAPSHLEALRRRLGLTERDHAIVLHMRASKGRVPSWVEPMPGVLVLGRFRIERPLGHGGQGTAYLARDEQLQRTVVLKAIHTDRTPEALVREARALAAVRHPGVVAVYDVHQTNGSAFLVMEHVPGGSLKDRLSRRDGVAPAEFAPLALDLCDAVAAVHAAGFVHRDIKPANILLGPDGRPKLADFGVAILAGVDETRPDSGEAAGTLRYMSPEQARGEPASSQSDQYALALTLHEALSGRPYFEPQPGESAADVRARAARPEPYRAIATAPRGVNAWLARALEAAPGNRFPSVEAMGASLRTTLAAHAA